MTQGHVTLITGGVRSGKSAYAQALAAADGRSVAFVATAQAFDEEFRLRIARHQRDRPAGWRTLEEPLHLQAAVADAWRSAEVTVVDDLAIWTSNRLLSEAGDPDHAGWHQQLGVLDAALANEALGMLRAVPAGHRLILVTQEVGWGVVPPYPLGRAFRDALGRVNQRVAAEALAVVLMVAGIKLTLKGRPDQP